MVVFITLLRACEKSEQREATRIDWAVIGWGQQREMDNKSMQGIVQNPLHTLIIHFPLLASANHRCRASCPSCQSIRVASLCSLFSSGSYPLTVISCCYLEFNAKLRLKVARYGRTLSDESMLYFADVFFPKNVEILHIFDPTRTFSALTPERGKISQF